MSNHTVIVFISTHLYIVIRIVIVPPYFLIRNLQLPLFYGKSRFFAVF